MHTPKEQRSPYDKSVRTRSLRRQARAAPPQRQGDRASGDDASGRTFQTGPQVEARYGVTDMTIWRWLKNPKLGFPQPTMTVNGRRYWDEAELRQWELSRVAPRGEVTAP
jgi:predicted DNA-binding transcriptional regulator AlpA